MNKKSLASFADLRGRAAIMAEQASDYLVNTDHIEMTYGNVEPHREGGAPLGIKTPDGEFGLTDTAVSQIAQYNRIPKPFFDRLAVQEPELLIETVNRLMHHEPDARLLRTLDPTNGGAPTMRAFLSDKFKRLDNAPILNQLEPMLANFDLEVTRTALTTDFMSLQVRFPKVEAEVKKGDIVQSGFQIENSEVGRRKFLSAYATFRLLCTNGMVRMTQEMSISRVHVGASLLDSGDGEFTRAESMIEHIIGQVHGIAENAANGSFLEKEVSDVRGGVELMVDRPDAAVNYIAKRNHLPNFERELVREHLNRESDFSVWGLANAVTRTAQDARTAERANALEALGGNVALYRQPWLDAIPVEEVAA